MLPKKCALRLHITLRDVVLFDSNVRSPPRKPGFGSPSRHVRDAPALSAVGAMVRVPLPCCYGDANHEEIMDANGRRGPFGRNHRLLRIGTLVVWSRRDDLLCPVPHVPHDRRMRHLRDGW